MNTVELLPCPFCGGKAKVERERDVNGCIWVYVRCQEKSCRTKGHENWCSPGNDSPQMNAEAIAAWNRRSLPAGASDTPVALGPNYAPLGLAYRKRGTEEWSVRTFSAPDSWELRECDLLPLYASPVAASTAPPERLHAEMIRRFPGVDLLLDTPEAREACAFADGYAFASPPLQAAPQAELLREVRDALEQVKAEARSEDFIRSFMLLGPRCLLGLVNGIDAAIAKLDAALLPAPQPDKTPQIRGTVADRSPSSDSHPALGGGPVAREVLGRACTHGNALPCNDCVICPNCAEQFRAIPVNVQKLLLAAGYEPPFYTEKP